MLTAGRVVIVALALPPLGWLLLAARRAWRAPAVTCLAGAAGCVVVIAARMGVLLDSETLVPLVGLGYTLLGFGLLGLATTSIDVRARIARRRRRAAAGGHADPAALCDHDGPGRGRPVARDLVRGGGRPRLGRAHAAPAGRRERQVGRWSRTPSVRTQRWSICSTRSLLSIASTDSVLSIGSVGSVLSIGSLGSACSAWSVGSFGSFGSVLSARSRWSLLSDRSYDAVLGSQTAHTRAGSLSAVQLAAGLAVAVAVARRLEARRRR